jgi:hypothetical protein
MIRDRMTENLEWCGSASTRRAAFMPKSVVPHECVWHHHGCAARVRCLCMFCPAAAVDAIVRGGFDLTRVNGASVYGRGHYFAGALLLQHNRRLH